LLKSKSLVLLYYSGYKKVNISTILYLDNGYSGKDKGYPR
jgi:hypothetical protein